MDRIDKEFYRYPRNEGNLLAPPSTKYVDLDWLNRPKEIVQTVVVQKDNWEYLIKRSQEADLLARKIKSLEEDNAFLAKELNNSWEQVKSKKEQYLRQGRALELRDIERHPTAIEELIDAYIKKGIRVVKKALRDRAYDLDPASVL